MRTRIKVCGVKDADSAFAAATAGADAVGLVFIPDSPRAIDPDAAYDVMGALPPLTTAVGVFRNHSLDDFSDIEERCPTPLTQLDGTEDDKLVRKCGPDVIKSIRYDPDTIARDLARWDALDEVCAILIHVAADSDPNTLVPHLDPIRSPIVLAGELNPANVERWVRIIQPWAVDASVGVESAPGVIDLDKVEAFCAAVRSADAALNRE